jgi:hypothetical protein
MQLIKSIMKNALNDTARQVTLQCKESTYRVDGMGKKIGL